jgi:phenylalanyl-tRNA synthetase alpha chain
MMSTGMQFDDLDPQVVEGILAKIAVAENEAVLEVIRVSELGKRGRITTIARMIGGIPNEEQRRHHGEIINQAKDRVEAAIAARKRELKEQRIADETGSAPVATNVGVQSSVSASVGKSLSASIGQAVSVATTVIRAGVDVTQPVREAAAEIGRVHPLTQVFDEVTAVFADMGFAVAEGPDIETDDNNFTKLNFPADHPARDMQDTFFFHPKPDGSRLLLRTHTSPVQVRTMLSQKPPIRIICPGRTYRSDSDQTHTPMFHQVEGLVVDRGSHLGHLKWILQEFCKAFFEVDQVKMRFRPSFFPFTEPSLEVDIQCRRDKGEVRFGEGDDWMEILGCGMVHPNVLRNCGIDPDEFQGFAWGMGIDRIAMLKYGMPDLRAFFEADVRWLSHYGFRPLDVPTLAGGLSS